MGITYYMVERSLTICYPPLVGKAYAIYRFLNSPATGWDNDWQRLLDIVDGNETAAKAIYYLFS